MKTEQEVHQRAAGSDQSPCPIGRLRDYSELASALSQAPQSIAERNSGIEAVMGKMLHWAGADLFGLILEEGFASLVSCHTGRTEILPLPLVEVRALVEQVRCESDGRADEELVRFLRRRLPLPLPDQIPLQLLRLGTDAHVDGLVFMARIVRPAPFLPIEQWALDDLRERLRYFIESCHRSGQLAGMVRERQTFAAIIEDTPDPVVVTDKRGIITYLNPGASGFLGDITGRRIAGVYYSDHLSTGRAKALDLQRKLLRSKDGRIVDLETLFTSKEGKALPVSISANLLRDERGRIIGSIGIAKVLRKIKALSVVQEVIATTLDVDQILKSVMDAVIDILGFDYVTISKVDLTNATVGTIDGRHVSRDFINTAWHGLDSDDIQAWIVRNRQEIYLTGWDDRLDRRIYEAYGHENLVRFYLPILSRNEAYGTLETGYFKQNRSEITEDEKAILRRIATLAGLGIDQAYLLQEQQKLVDQLQALNESSLFIQKAVSVNEVVRNIFKSLEQIGYSKGMVSLIVPKSNRVEGFYAVGAEWEKIRSDTKRDLNSEDILVRAINERKPILSRYCRDDISCDQNAVRKAKIISQLVLPIIGPKGPLGTLQIDFSDKQGLIKGPVDILERHIRLLETFTSQIAIAMARTNDHNLIDLLQTTLMETAHEFRSPLHNIMAQIGSLRQFFPPEASRDKEVENIFKIISEEAHRARSQMENTLLFSDKTRSLSGYHFEVGHIQDLIRICTNNFRLRALERGISFIPKENLNRLPAFLFDRQKIEQVLNNLVDNAVKYSHSGRFIQIQGFDDGTQIHIEVWDKGLGIPESDYERIFDGLERGAVRDNRRYIPGTGLGLKIAKEIVEAHGGVIRVKSTPFFNDIDRIREYDGYDTMFTIILPKKPQER